MAIPDLLARKLDTLPDRPGVYLWKDAAGQILYVGKAKSLRARVPAYFPAEVQETPERAALARQIADLETIVVPSEAQALLLENNLIKEHKPRFNIRLTDDKSYPRIAVTLGEPRRPLLRAVHRRQHLAANAEDHPAPLHGALVPLRPAGRPSRPPLPRLPH